MVTKAWWAASLLAWAPWVPWLLLPPDRYWAKVGGTGTVAAASWAARSPESTIRAVGALAAAELLKAVRALSAAPAALTRSLTSSARARVAAWRESDSNFCRVAASIFAGSPPAFETSWSRARS